MNTAICLALPSIGNLISRMPGGVAQGIIWGLMASLRQPKLLLLDEHTAALDPATAAKVLAISDEIIKENNLTAVMITHNMKDALEHGSRLIMMDQGRINWMWRARRKRT